MNDLKINQELSEISLSLWQGMRRIMGKSDLYSPTMRGPTGNPLTDDLSRYTRMLKRGGALGMSKDSHLRLDTKVITPPTRPGTSFAREEQQTKQNTFKIPAAFDDEDCSFEHVTDSPLSISAPLPKIHEKVSSGNKELFETSWGKLAVSGPTTLDQIDEAVAEVHETFPWMREATTSVWKRFRRQIQETGQVSHFGALLLAGPPGVGKTSWARELARCLKIGAGVQIDAAASPAGFSLVGLEIGWGGAFPGGVVKEILEHQITNPIVVVDEIDKACIARSSGGQSFSIANSLLGMMGPAATGWSCPYFRVKFDVSKVSWVLTANEIHNLPSPLLSRCELVNVPYPNDAEIYGMIDKISKNELAIEIVKDVVKEKLKSGDKISPRFVERLMNQAMDSLSQQEIVG